MKGWASALTALAVAATMTRAAAVPAGESASAYWAQGQASWRSGRLTEAVTAYNRALALDPRDERAYIGLAVLYEAVGRSDLAVDALAQLELAAPQAPHLRCRQSEAFLGVDDTRQALAVGAEAVAREPDCPRALSAYGIAAARNRYWDTAASALERARMLAPDDPTIAATVIEVYLKQGDNRRVIAAATPMLRADPHSAALHYRLGWAYARLPQIPEHTRQAENMLRRAAELSPRWFEPHAELGRLYASLGKPRLAALSFEQAWRLGPGSAGVAYNLARLWRQLGDPRAAGMMREYQRLLALQAKFTSLRGSYNNWPEDPETVLALADSEAQSGLYAPALHRLRKLLARQPGHAAALERYVRMDRRSRAHYPALLRPGPGVSLAVR